jgi:hypothetical protein
MKAKVVAAGLLTGALCMLLNEDAALAQQDIPPTVERDPNWDAVSSISMMIGVGSVALMPRVYYSSPDATVGWKARWHVSSLVPTLGLTGLTLLVDGPIRNAIQSPKEGCTLDDTLNRPPDGDGCESFGGPSTHAFASWGATGAGMGIFLVDMFEYSDSEFNVPSLLGNVAVPLTASIMSSVSRSADGRGVGPEGTGQVVAGALPGFAVGMLLGVGYSMLQEPDCGYGGYIFCW